MRRSPLWLAAFLFAAPAAAHAGVSGRANELYFQGRFDEALRAYREAVARSTTDASAALNLGILYRDAGRPEDAARAFESAASLRPSDSDAWNALGEAALQTRDLERAQRAFSKAVAADPGHFYARLGLGRVHLERGEPALAVRRFEEAARTRPSAALAPFYLGRALEAQGLTERARESYLEALRKDSQFSEIRLVLGGLYRAQGQSNEAWVQFAKAADLDPGHAAAVRAKQSLSAQLTRKPEELIPVVRIEEPRRVSPAPERPGSPLLKVAIGTTASGQIAALKALSVRSSGAFAIERKADGKRLAEGKPGEVWIFRKIPHQGGFEVIGPGPRRAAVFSAPIVLRPLDEDRDTLVLDAIPSAKGYAWASLKDREVREIVELRPQAGVGIALVNHVHLEDYLYGVVSEEMPIAWPLEALKAQAVIARTHALYVRGGSPHRASGYDLCDGQHCQVYGGVAAEFSRTRDAVDATRGEVLKGGGGLAQTLYSSNCGGHTQSSEEAGWSPSPVLKGAPDTEPGVAFPRTPWEFEVWVKHEARAYCRNPRFTHPPEYRWARVVSAEDLSARVNRKAPVGRLRAVRPVARGRSGHVHKVEFVGAQGSWSVSQESALRRILGLGPARSTFFVAEAYRGKDGRVAEYVLHGAGWGHGVGLCQSGAAGRAAAGSVYREILAHYYPGAALGKLDEKPAPKRPPVKRKG